MRSTGCSGVWPALDVRVAELAFCGVLSLPAGVDAVRLLDGCTFDEPISKTKMGWFGEEDDKVVSTAQKSYVPFFRVP